MSIIIVICILSSPNWTLNNEPNNGSHFLVVEFFICFSLVQRGSVVHALHVTRHLLLMDKILVCLYSIPPAILLRIIYPLSLHRLTIVLALFMVGHSNFFFLLLSLSLTHWRNFNTHWSSGRRRRRLMETWGKNFNEESLLCLFWSFVEECWVLLAKLLVEVLIAIFVERKWSFGCILL